MSVEEVVSVRCACRGGRVEGALLSLSRGEDIVLLAMTAANSMDAELVRS